MTESGYYPPGAEFDPRAPWNEVEIEPKELNICASQTIHKETTIEVNDYYVDEYDDYDFSNCDLNTAFKEQHLSAVEALKLAAEFAVEVRLALSDNKELNKMAIKVFNACEGWEEDEFEIVKE